MLSRTAIPTPMTTWMTTLLNAHNRLNARMRRKSKFGISRSDVSDPDVVVEPDELAGGAARRQVLQPEVGERHPRLIEERVERDDPHHEERRQHVEDGQLRVPTDAALPAGRRGPAGD